MPPVHRPVAPWPELPLEAWAATAETLHLWTQIVGKVRLAQTPWTNHSWHFPLYVAPRGLRTGPIPYGQRLFEIAFDFAAHDLRIDVSDGARRVLPLRPQTVASFYADLMGTLEHLGLPVQIHGAPNEVEAPIPFAEDTQHGAYNAIAVGRFWQMLTHAHRVLTLFRTRYLGKVSPVHFFWGSFDLAVTRFSGREAPRHPGGIPHLPDWVVREAYSHEVSSAGFWTGGGPHPFPLFYSYAYPQPEGFPKAAGLPGGAFFSRPLGEFVLPYDAVRQAPDPDAVVLAFLEATYAAAADLGEWPRDKLEFPSDPKGAFGEEPAG